MNDDSGQRESFPNTVGKPAKWQGQRRRWLEIVGIGGLGLALPGHARAHNPKPLIWKGELLGAPTSITLWHEDRAAAGSALAAVAEIVTGLEAQFSLQRPDSALSRLNREGRLAAPSSALLESLALSRELNAASEGAFDPSVQPLWSLFAAHFRRADADPAGPSAAAIAAARERVGLSNVLWDESIVRYARVGTALTLNGVAQGYITDRAREVLARHGLRHCLVNLGEFRALGTRPGAPCWRLALTHPNLPWRRIATVALEADKALATSAGAGTPFDARGRFHHLFDPRTGRSADGWRSVSVVADSAALADGLSTALAVAPPARATDILSRFPGTSALLLDDDDRLHALGEPLRLN